MKWFKSFLQNWQQIVKHNNKVSSIKTITRGIIQEENYSQLLFSLFINNVTKYMRKTILFADDVQIYIKCDIDKITDGIKSVNDEIKNIERYCNDYGIDITPNKTKAIIRFLKK